MIYRITGVKPNGARETLRVGIGSQLAIYESAAFAERELVNIRYGNGKWPQRRYSDIRLESSDTEWTPR